MHNRRSSTPKARRGVHLAMLVLGACAVMSTANAQSVTLPDQVRNLNGQVLRLQAEVRRAQTPAAAAATKQKAADVLAARAATMAQLIAANPTQAAALAFPANVLQQLASTFPESAASLEKRGRWQGELEYRIEDDVSMRSSRDIYRLHGATETLELKFSGREPPGLQSGMRLDVGGVRSGKAVAATEVEVVDASQTTTTSTTSSTTTTSGTATSCGPTGPQSVLTVLVNFPSYTLPSAVTPAFMLGVLQGNAAGGAQNSPDWSVDDFWHNNSDGQTYVDPTYSTVVGPITLSSNYNTDSTGATMCDNYGVQDAVLKMLDPQINFQHYNRIQIVMPPNGACSWAGTANVGCRSLSTTGDGTFSASVAWQRADTMQTRLRGVELSTHEMGHNLGMKHASSRDFGSEALGALGATGTLTEYGDMHSTMGPWDLGFYNASHAANQLGWLKSGAGYQVVQTSGTYTIANYEAQGGALRALKVQRGTGNDAWLWIESRQNTGIYSSTLNSSLFGGALIHYQDSQTGNYSHLLDFTTGTSSFTDAALPVGSTWTDPYSNVSITVNSVSPGSMTVTVNYSGVTCTPAAPTLTASPTGTSAEYGSSTQFSVTVKDNSSSGCGSETYNLSSVVPSGWSGTFAAGSVTLSPGQQASTTLTVGVPAPYALGTYAVTSNVNSAATGKSASDSDNVTVIEPTNTLSLGIGGSGTVALSTPAQTCTSACTVNYTGSTTVVTLTATPAPRFAFAGWSGACSGTSTTCSLTMSADKSVTANFKRASGKK